MAARKLIELAAVLTGDELEAAITAAINAGELCGGCDGHGKYLGWTCTTCGGSGEGADAAANTAAYKARVAEQLLAVKAGQTDTERERTAAYEALLYG
jgi:DnaJ-class molecular chaperone